MKIVAWRARYYEAHSIVDEYLRRVGEILKDHDFIICEDMDSIKREIADADAMVGWNIAPEIFAQAKRLKWIQFGSAGIDHTVFPELLASDVIITTMSGIHAQTVAEHVFAQMLALTRRLDLAFDLQRNHSFDRAEIAATSDELACKTLGIIGLGKIGMSIARIGMAFGMAVIGTKRTPEPNMLVDEVYPPEQLHEVLKKSDFLVLVAPLTSETKAMIGKDEIAHMKDGAYIINVARGAMIDHDALAHALSTGKLAGAALDVFPIEPLPKESPIYNLPNTIITPHTAGSSPCYAKRAANIFETNFKAFVSGENMINVYDRAKGY